jgi:hypothetical protein
MPTPAPIQGNFALTVGQTSTYTNTTVGGVWSSSDTAIFTVSVSGVVTAIGAGAANIVYTVGTDSIAAPISVTLNTTTNGLNFNNVYNALKNRVLWQSQSVASLSGRYFEDFHPLCNTNILLHTQGDSTITSTGSAAFTTYLANLQRSVVLEVLNATYNQKPIINKTQLCFQRPDVMLYPQPVANQGQFVGIKMYIAPGEDIAVRFSSVELFFNGDKTFNLYLYNDMTLPPIFTKSVTTQANQQVIVDLSNDAVFNYLSTTINKGGIFYFGYYQEDLDDVQAIFYSVYNTLYNGCFIWAFSAPQTEVSGTRNFQRNNIGANNLTYGMNVEASVYVDATNNIVQNQNLFDEVIGLTMAVRVIENIIFNYRANGVQTAINGIAQLKDLYAQLNGLKADEDIPYVMGLKDKLSRAINTCKKGMQEDKKTFVGIS